MPIGSKHSIFSYAVTRIIVIIITTSVELAVILPKPLCRYEDDSTTSRPRLHVKPVGCRSLRRSSTC